MGPTGRESGAARSGPTKAGPLSAFQAPPVVSWHEEGGVLAIEFHRVALEQIRQACLDVPRGPQSRGSGVAGLLLGTRLGDYWRVHGWQRFDCGSSRESPFQLDGAADQARLRQQILELSAGEHQLIGWFASHARGGLDLTQVERSVHAEYFSGVERLMLTARISRHGDMMLQIHFPAARLDDRLLARPPEIRVVPMPAALFPAARSGQVEPPRIAAAPVPAALHSRVQSTYLGFGFAAVLVIAAALGVLYWQATQDAPALSPDAAPAASATRPGRLLSLHAEYRPPRLTISWDSRAYEAAEIAAATVVCSGDSFSRRVRLGDAAIRRGRASIPLRRPPGLVALTLRTRDGREIKESVSFADSRGNR